MVKTRSPVQIWQTAPFYQEYQPRYLIQLNNYRGFLIPKESFKFKCRSLNVLQSSYPASTKNINLNERILWLHENDQQELIFHSTILFPALESYVLRANPPHIDSRLRPSVGSRLRSFIWIDKAAINRQFKGASHLLANHCRKSQELEFSSCFVDPDKASDFMQCVSRCIALAMLIFQKRQY